MIVSNFFLWCFIFVSLYEIVPEQLCRIGDNSLPHFAGIVSCNGFAENLILSASVVFFISAFLFFRRRKYLFNMRDFVEPSDLLLWVAKFSTAIVVAAVAALWWKTGLSIFPDKSARSSLVVEYHAVFGHPLVAPFLYVAIISTTYLFSVYKEKWLWIVCVVAISFGCYITMSRGFILSVILPFFVTQPFSRMIKFFPILIFVFFLRDMINGNVISYVDAGANSDAVSTLVDALGEFTNTYFGRRYFIDNAIAPEYIIFLVENFLKASGIYYLLSPIFKFFAALGLEVSSSTQAINDGIESVLGLTGFAGSYLSDLVIFFPVSLVAMTICFFIVAALYSRNLNSAEKYIFMLLASMLLPNAFRWSAAGYLSMLSGVLISYCLVRTSFSTLKFKIKQKQIVIKG